MLDGWWAEGYDGGNGWALSGDVDHDHGAQDQRDAHELYRLLEEEVAPEFYDRDDAGHPARLARARARVAEDQRARRSPRRACCATTSSSSTARLTARDAALMRPRATRSGEPGPGGSDRAGYRSS